MNFIINGHNLGIVMLFMLHRNVSSMAINDGTGDGVYSHESQHQIETFVEGKHELSKDNPDWYFQRKNHGSLTKQSPEVHTHTSAARQFMFWKTISKSVIPQVKFIQKATESTLSLFCHVIEHGLQGEDCFKFGEYLLSKWSPEDFLRTPSKEVVTIKKQHKFQKALVENLISVLRSHRDNLTQILEMEKKEYCDRKQQEDCDVDCVSPFQFDSDHTRLYCDISQVILLNLNKVLATLEKEGRRYFKIKIKTPREETHRSTKEIYTRNTDFYKLAVLYNIMQQNYETEAALEYIVEISNIERFVTE